MKVTYRPEDGAEQVWEFRPGRVRAAEAEMCAKRLEPKKWGQFEGDIMTGDPRALKVLLWYLMRRDHPALRWEDVPDFCMDEIMVENDLEDNKRIRDRFASMPKTDELREAMEALEQQIAEQEEAEGELVGKPISKKGGSAIG